MDASLHLAPQIQIPSLVLSAGQDVFIHPKQIEDWFQKIGAPDKTLRLYPEAHHLLWNDWDKEQVLVDIQEWLRIRS
jgi:alpha-beta hydrolase superfamily lysophospholipase